MLNPTPVGTQIHGDKWETASPEEAGRGLQPCRPPTPARVTPRGAGPAPGRRAAPLGAAPGLQATRLAAQKGRSSGSLRPLPGEPPFCRVLPVALIASALPSGSGHGWSPPLPPPAAAAQAASASRSSEQAAAATVSPGPGQLLPIKPRAPATTQSAPRPARAAPRHVTVAGAGSWGGGGAGERGGESARRPAPEAGAACSGGCSRWFLRIEHTH